MTEKAWLPSEVNKEIRAALEAPLHPDEIEWRVGSSGITNNRPWAKMLGYVTARGVHRRLSEVFGVMGWQISYRFHSWESLAKDRHGENLTDPEGNFIREPHNGAVAILKVRMDGDGWGDEWVTFEDVCEFTDFEAFKGGASGAIKRAVVPLGIGAYLYKLGASWAIFTKDGDKSLRIDGAWHKYIDPNLPTWALPEGVDPDTQTKVVEKTAAGQPKRPDAPMPEGATKVVSDDDWINVVIHFGKHKGKTLGDLPPAYLGWLRGKWLADKNATLEKGEKVWGSDLTLMTLLNKLHKKADESQEETVLETTPHADTVAAAQVEEGLELSPFTGDDEDEEDVPF